ncbi:MAG: endonuclease/exonuclease/phosphatase family protein [Planctomycetota bacterium]|nr:endonuclease/exonuclease/phosphatase family protein [Planctomycetota bacterium]MDA1178738.1 endonuclease/exonuclease/phosphatase family protein [Planctomycetota bacterium]
MPRHDHGGQMFRGKFFQSKFVAVAMCVRIAGLLLPLVPFAVSASDVATGTQGASASRISGTIDPHAIPRLEESLLLPTNTIRIATFNVSLVGRKAGDLRSRLATGSDRQAQAVSEIIQRANPDILLINELDFDGNAEILSLLKSRYLEVPQNSCGLSATSVRAIHFPYSFIAPVNTGEPSNHDLDHDGQVGQTVDTEPYARDAWGYGKYPGQYGMAVLSKFPIRTDQTRTFRKFRWRDMPGALTPVTLENGVTTRWYNEEIMQSMPLSSKSHWDVVIDVRGKMLHLLASHPTPPVFDGPEDRNGCRNHDEIRFWSDYLTLGTSSYIRDDEGQMGGLEAEALFVVCGDQNSDPHDGNDARHSIRQLLFNPSITSSFTPRSLGGREQALLQSGSNQSHSGDPSADTGDWLDKNDGPGNLRLDYALCSQRLRVVKSAVFWPDKDDPHFPLVGTGHPVVSSDHRLVWIDVIDPNIANHSQKPN